MTQVPEIDFDSFVLLCSRVDAPFITLANVPENDFYSPCVVCSVAFHAAINLAHNCATFNRKANIRYERQIFQSKKEPSSIMPGYFFQSPPRTPRKVRGFFLLRKDDSHGNDAIIGQKVSPEVSKNDGSERGKAQGQFGKAKSNHAETEISPSWQQKTYRQVNADHFFLMRKGDQRNEYVADHKVSLEDTNEINQVNKEHASHQPPCEVRSGPERGCEHDNGASDDGEVNSTDGNTGGSGHHYNETRQATSFTKKVKLRPSYPMLAPLTPTNKSSKFVDSDTSPTGHDEFEQFSLQV